MSLSLHVVHAAHTLLADAVSKPARRTDEWLKGTNSC